MTVANNNSGTRLAMSLAAALLESASDTIMRSDAPLRGRIEAAEGDITLAGMIDAGALPDFVWAELANLSARLGKLLRGPHGRRFIVESGRPVALTDVEAEAFDREQDARWHQPEPAPEATYQRRRLFLEETDEQTLVRLLVDARRMVRDTLVQMIAESGEAREHRSHFLRQAGW